MRNLNDPIFLEILWSRLIAIVDEAALALQRTAFSSVVRESNDYAVVLMDAQGNAMAHNTLGVPSFSSVVAITTRHLLKEYGEHWMEGDIAMTNDPWLATGHLPDTSLVIPIFHAGRLVAFAGSVAHKSDIGGIGRSASAREVYEEGLFIPPVKIRKAGRLDGELLKLVKWNVRVPDEVIGDLYAQITACDLCAQKLSDLMKEQGLDTLTEISDSIRCRAEAVMRRAIAEIPDGTYPYRITTDGIDHPLIIQTAVKVDGNKMMIDYSGTSDQVDRGINCVFNYTYSFSSYAIKCALDPLSPRNEGSFKPITVYAPPGSLLNANFPAPVMGRHLTGQYLAYAVLGALSQVVPGKVIAEGGGPSTRINFRGRNQNNEPFSYLLFANGGMGALVNKDGLACTGFPSNAGHVPVEMVENRFPLVVHRKELATDSGGLGQYRGGLGQEVEIEVVSPTPMTVSVMAERVKYPARGLAGGLSGSPVLLWLNGKQTVDPKGVMTLKFGDRLTVRFAGGGGYGSPETRDPAAVQRDLSEGLISAAASERWYGLKA